MPAHHHDQPVPVLAGHYESDGNTLWVRCPHCDTWRKHFAPGLPTGRIIDRGPHCTPPCPYRASGYRIEISPLPLAEAACEQKATPV